MKIAIEYNFYILRQMVNREAEIFEADENLTFSRLLALLGEKYGATAMSTVFDPSGGMLKTPVLVNGVPLTDPNLPLKDGDRINILARTTSG